jgi:hypothetical protein
VTTVPALNATFPAQKNKREPTPAPELMKRATVTTLPSFAQSCTEIATALSSGCSCLLGSNAAVRFPVHMLSPPFQYLSPPFSLYIIAPNSPNCTDNNHNPHFNLNPPPPSSMLLPKLLRPLPHPANLQRRLPPQRSRFLWSGIRSLSWRVLRLLSRIPEL